MTTWILLLIGVSFAAALAVGVVPGARRRNPLITLGCVAIAALSVAAAVDLGLGGRRFAGLPGGIEPGPAILAAEALIAVLVIGIGLRHRRLFAPALAAIQLAIAILLETGGHAAEVAPERIFAFDQLTLVMVLIIGLVGPLICFNAIGYMRDYQRSNPMIGGRRAPFFFLLFLFLGAMFGLVAANDLAVLHVFWEVTTLCSFLLIGYTRTSETIGYAFRALNMNLLGGVAFSVALLLLAQQPDGLDLAAITAGPAGPAVLPAIALLALAGLTKSAQMPFSSWLLGAMYAPSPTSALLHSSTMVKAGVFLLLRLAPAMSGSLVGTLVAATGLLTFVMVSAVAVTEQNTKKVLAYSTIANLGLITACAGIATPETIWVGALVVIFHAVAKGLLFLVVGTLENRLYTKDMEHFDTLLARMPRVSILALTGIAGMFIAPFGLVLAKWSAIRAFLEVPGAAGAILLIGMAFGSSLTIFYWGKLLTKILATRRIDPAERAIEGRVSREEWLSEGILAAAVLVVAALVGPISHAVIGPWASAAFGAPAEEFLHLDLPVLLVLFVTILLLPALGVIAYRAGDWNSADFYASGRPTNAGHAIGAAMGGERQVSLRNYYLTGVLDGAGIFRAGTVIAALLLVSMLAAGTVIR